MIWLLANGGQPDAIAIMDQYLQSKGRFIGKHIGTMGLASPNDRTTRASAITKSRSLGAGHQCVEPGYREVYLVNRPVCDDTNGQFNAHCQSRMRGEA